MQEKDRGSLNNDFAYSPFCASQSWRINWLPRWRLQWQQTAVTQMSPFRIRPSQKNQRKIGSSPADVQSEILITFNLIRF